MRPTHPPSSQESHHVHPQPSHRSAGRRKNRFRHRPDAGTQRRLFRAGCRPGPRPPGRPGRTGLRDAPDQRRRLGGARDRRRLCRGQRPAVPSRHRSGRTVREGRRALLRPDRRRRQHPCHPGAGRERAQRADAAMRPGARLHRHCRQRAGATLRHLAGFAHARRRPAALSLQQPALQPDVEHRRADQRILQPVRGHRGRPADQRARVGRL
ncbi:hypothetical protein G6F65_020805 [Rhizopus arrhizus]|nr:hypothetical protein G6F65_020805 [Rhizopus arrhizus]